MNKDNIAKKGEQLTFYKLFADKQWKVEIPIIQRDYAQGRKSAREVRETFIDTLYQHLIDNDNIDLDFIYGSLEGKNNELFIPLDGQQRLTTLFLLHWYLANKEDKQEQLREFLVTDEGKSNFTYETRASAREFCDELVNFSIDFYNLKILDEGKHNSLSKIIEDQNWFFLSWRNDPTIQAMLIMLDDIHNKFNENKNYFDKLIDKKNPVITFQFLELEKFGLTDDLYIKMNARGKQLTAFENFKAKFEQLIKEMEVGKTYQLKIGNKSRTVSAHKYFSHKIDRDWTDMFWNYKNTISNDNTFDDEIMNFIRLVITNHYAINTSHNTKKRTENLQLLFDNDMGDNHLSYLQYKELGCLDEDLVTDLIAIFDLLANRDKKIKKYLKDTFYYDEEEVFISAIINNTGYRGKIRFYAVYKHIIYNETGEGLSDWMRVVYNLTENHIYDQPDDFISSIRFINQLIKHSRRINDYLAGIKRLRKSIHQAQLSEERIKARLIQKSDDWKKMIFSIERHPYFTGQIGFILNYAGIEDYFKQNFQLNWSNTENANYLSSFNNYSIKAKTIFYENNFKNLNNYVWERTLLTKGDYILKEGSNMSFCTYDKDRDISWKRLLLDGGRRKDYPGHVYRRNLVKEVFDDNDFNINNLQESLENIIKKHQVNNWYKPFIDNPNLFNHLGTKKYIRKESESKIYLLEGERMSGKHSELYSLIFYIKHLNDDNDNFSPFKETYYYKREDPCAVIDKWYYKGAKYAINIFYRPEKEKFEIRIFDSNYKDLSDVKSLLIQNGMEETPEYNDKSYIIFKDTEKDTLNFLTTLCEEINKIQP